MIGKQKSIIHGKKRKEKGKVQVVHDDEQQEIKEQTAQQKREIRKLS